MRKRPVSLKVLIATGAAAAGAAALTHPAAAQQPAQPATVDRSADHWAGQGVYVQGTYQLKNSLFIKTQDTSETQTSKMKKSKKKKTEGGSETAK